MKRRWSQAVSGAPSTRTEPGGAGPGSGTLVGAPNVALGPPQRRWTRGWDVGRSAQRGTRSTPEPSYARWRWTRVWDVGRSAQRGTGSTPEPSYGSRAKPDHSHEGGMLLHPNQWHSVHLRAIRRSADRFVSRCYDLDNCEQGSRCWRLDGWP